MKEEFSFILGDDVYGSEEGVMFKAKKEVVGEGRELYYITWRNCAQPTPYILEHVEAFLNNGDWIEVSE